MWYACFPSAAVVGLAISLPHIFFYFENKLRFGNAYRRYVSNKYDVQTYVRDMRLGNGNAYKQIGLECLPDEPCECK